MNTYREKEKQAIEYLQQRGGQARLHEFIHQSILESLIEQGVVQVVLQKPNNDKSSTWFVCLMS